MNNQQTSKEKVKWLIILHLAFLMYSFGGVISKTAAGVQFLSLKFIVLYAGLMLVLFVYALLWQQIIKRMKLSTAYANKAVLTFWASLWSVVFFNEKLSPVQMIGIAIIIAGVILLSTGKDAENV